MPFKANFVAMNVSEITEEAQKEIFRKHYYKIIEKIIPNIDEIIDYLYGRGSLTQHQEELLMSHLDNTEKARTLIDIIAHICHGWEAFMDALSKFGDDVLRNELELKRRLLLANDKDQIKIKFIQTNSPLSDASAQVQGSCPNGTFEPVNEFVVNASSLFKVQRDRRCSEVDGTNIDKNNWLVS